MDISVPVEPINSFALEGGAESTSLTSAVFTLFINGVLIESTTSTSLSISFDKIDQIEDSTIYCSVTISQEGITQQFKSLDNSLTRVITQGKKDAFAIAAADYQVARDAAYALRIQGNVESTLVWRKSLDVALAKRAIAEDSATATYAKSLEEAGISLFIAAPEVKKPDPKVDPKEPEKPNVQPTSVMRKVGTIYFANGTYFINDASRKSLLAIAKKISAGSAKMILSYGHTDSTKGVDNIVLSKNRARAVAAVLRQMLSGKKIVTGWYASTKPISTGSSKADLAKNRRVEIYIK